ncbi:hypothetical protein KJ763_00110 [Patescibacteria group bacterium]|nr:hypothetical protein [Patescibacteria group bacterium]
MKNIDDKKLITAIILLLVFVVIYFVFNTAFRKNALTLILDFGNGSQKTFYNYSQEEKNAWGVLQQVAIISSLDLQASPGFFPKKIDGRANGEENKLWNLYVNGVKQEASPIDIKVNVPDKVIYKFE